MNNVETVIKRLINKGDRIGAAVSGGCDSMCLLDLLCKYKDEVGYTVCVLNAEHGIRGEESVRDTEFVRRYCAEAGIEFIGESFDSLAYANTNKVTVEQAARALRYAFFDRNLGVTVDKIATAHHKDDLCETVFMRIMRGSGIAGLVGIKEKREGYIRPLLSVCKEELYAYAAANSLPYVEDSTNLSTEYTRNYVRGELLPRVEERFPMYRTSLARLAAAAAEMTAYIDKVCPKPIFEENAAFLDVEQLKATDAVLAKRSIFLCVKALGAQVDFEEKHYGAVLKLLDAPNGSGVDLAQTLRAEREYGRLVFYRMALKSDQEFPYRIGTFDWQGVTAAVRPYATGDVIRFDAARIPEGATVRFRREGDFIAKFGGGTKNLGDFLTDKKIPRRRRDVIPVIAVGSEVLAIADLEISSKLRAEAEAPQLLTFTIR